MDYAIYFLATLSLVRRVFIKAAKGLQWEKFWHMILCRAIHQKNSWSRNWRPKNITWMNLEVNWQTKRALDKKKIKPDKWCVWLIFKLILKTYIILNVFIMKSRVKNQILKGATKVNISDKHTYSVKIAMPQLMSPWTTSICFHRLVRQHQI